MTNILANNADAIPDSFVWMLIIGVPLSVFLIIYIIVKKIISLLKNKNKGKAKGSDAALK